jgi:O-succinylbenzoic acid--CoA ligase
MENSKEMYFHFRAYKISNREINARVQDLTEYEIRVIKFANEWASGKEKFEFQTSGSTGTPRKIPFTRKQLKASAGLTKDFFQLKEGQTALLCLDPEFIAGKMMIVRALEIGMNLICEPPASNPIKTLKTSIDFAAFVPYQIETILNSSSSDKLDLIKTAIIGGSTVSDDLLKQVQTLPTQFFETYGMTETLTHIAVRKLNPVQPEFHTLPGIRISLDIRQCLTIQPSHLGDEIIQTNDVAILTDESSFKIIGRHDHIINTAGVKISPEVIESKIELILKTIVPERQYFIAGVSDIEFGQKIVLYIEMDELSLDTKTKLIEKFKSTLKKWEVPKEIVTIPAFKRTNSGKINRIITQSN